MNRITRYVIFEFAWVFLTSVTAMTSLMVMVFLIQEGMRESLTPMTILELIPFIIPTALSFAIPGTCLFAACIVYGRMSAANEIVAIKSQGIPPSRVIWPGIVVSFLLSLCTLYCNDIAVSWGKNGIYRVILNASANTIHSVLKAHGSFSKEKLSIIVDDVQGQDLINPYIEYQEGSTRNQIQASKARMSVAHDSANLVIQAQDSRVQMGDAQNAYLAGWKQFPIPLGNVTKREGPGQNPSNLPLSAMASELEKQNLHLDRMKRDMALNAAFDMVSGSHLELTSVVWNQKHNELEKEMYRKFRLEAEPWRRWANGFSCLCFVIVGAPLAIWMRKSDFWTVFAVCFIPILLGYYPLLMIGINQAKSGSMPPWIVWLGNVVMLVIGGTMIRKIDSQ